MSGRVIVDREVGQAPRGVGRTTRGLTSRLGSALASPVGVMTVVPLLVALVGLTLTWVGQSALRQTSLSMAEARFHQETTFTSRRLAQALGHAEPVLDRLADVAQRRLPDGEFRDLAFVLRDLIQGRPGMTQAYLGFPDGTFLGVYEGDGGRLSFQHSRLEGARAHIDHYDYGGTALVKVKEEVVDYDPRTRAWYRAAVSAKGRIWTDTYPFFTTGHTGVTRAAPVFATNGAALLHAVVGVDFDVSALSAFLGRVEKDGVHALVYAQDGSLLAYPRAARRIDQTRPSDHALNYRDLRDPLLDAYFTALSRKSAAQTAELWSFEWGETTMLTTASEVQVEGLSWRVASLASEQVILGTLRLHQRRSLAIAVAAVAVALFVSWLFARHIVRVRREVAAAREEAAVAVRRATELGSYRLVSCLGRGGMGEVWKAEHRLLAREAAVKLIVGELSEGPNANAVKERFKREAQTIAGLKSRNTVSLFDYGVTQDGTFFYVMEMLDGIDLETLVEKYGPQPPGRVIEILIQACYSLGEAHQAGLVHRDVKPANLFLCRAADEVDVIKVLDFGLVLAPNESHPSLAPPLPTASVDSATEPPSSDAAAVSGARLTAAGDYLGTPAFIAPEQALGQKVDGRSDLYALGCIGFWLLTGELPFEETTALAMMVAHITKPVRAIRPLVQGPLPAALETLLLGCMAKDPDERPRTARELISQLRAVELEPGEKWSEAQAEQWWTAYVPRPNEEMVSTMATITSDATSVLLASAKQA